MPRRHLLLILAEQNFSVSLILSSRRAYFPPPFLAGDKGEITGLGGNQSLLQTFRHSRKRNLKHHNYGIEFHCIMLNFSLSACEKANNAKWLSASRQMTITRWVFWFPTALRDHFRTAMTARKSLASMLCINRRYHADVGNNAVCWNKTLSVGTQLCF